MHDFINKKLKNDLNCKESNKIKVLCIISRNIFLVETFTVKNGRTDLTQNLFSPTSFIKKNDQQDEFKSLALKAWYKYICIHGVWNYWEDFATRGFFQFKFFQFLQLFRNKQGLQLQNSKINKINRNKMQIHACNKKITRLISWNIVSDSVFPADQFSF